MGALGAIAYYQIRVLDHEAAITAGGLSSPHTSILSGGRAAIDPSIMLCNTQGNTCGKKISSPHSCTTNSKNMQR